MTEHEKITALADEYLSNRVSDTTIKPLLVALGCAHVEGGSAEDKVVVPPQPAVAEDLIARILMRALCTQPINGSDFPEDGFSLLIGLAANQRWRVCLESHDTAYELAMALTALCIASPSVEAGLPLISIADEDICTLLNDWASPGTPFRHAPDPFRLIQCLFGEAWCALVVEDIPQRSYAIPGLIHSHRPPFREGLLPASLEAVVVGLPALDMP